MGTQRGIAHAEQNQVAVQDAIVVEFAVGNYVGGPGEGFDGQQGEGRGNGDELVVRGRGEEAGLIQSIERLAFEGGDADAELCMAQGGVGQNGGDAAGQGRCRRRGLRGGLGRGLGCENGGRNQGESQHKCRKRTKKHHGGSLRHFHASA